MQRLALHSELFSAPEILRSLYAKILPQAFYVLLFLFSSTLFGQPQIHGVIRIQNSKVNTGKTTYVALAQVEADYAGITKSGSDGMFTLKFAKNHSRKPIKINIEKAGLEVVNAEALSTFIPTEGKTDVLPFYMCPEGQLASSILKFRGVAESQITKQFSEKIKALERQNKATAIEMLKLEEERDLAISQSKKMARHLAVVNLDDELPVYQEAYQLFEQGKVEIASELIKEAKLSEQITSLKESKEFARRLDEGADLRLHNIASTLVFNANLAQTNLKFDEALFSYGEAIRASDSTEVMHNLAYAELLGMQTKFIPAIKLFKKTLSQVKDDLILQAYIQYHLGSVYFTNSNFEESISSFEAAHDMYQKSGANGQSATSEPLAAIIEILLGMSNLVKGNDEEALMWMRKSINSFEALSAVNPPEFSRYAAYAKVVGSACLSLDELEENIVQLRTLAKSDPDTYNSLLALANIAWISKYSTTQKGRSNEEENKNFGTKINSALQECFLLMQREVNNLGTSTSKTLSALKSPTELLPLPSLIGNGDRKAMMLFQGIKLLPTLTIIYSSYDDELAKKNYYLVKKIFDTAYAKCEEFTLINHDRFLPHYLEFSTIKGQMLGMEGEFDSALNTIDTAYEKGKLLASESPGTYDMMLALNRLLYFQTHHQYYYHNGVFKPGVNREILLDIIRTNEKAVLKHKDNLMISGVLETLSADQLALQRKHYPEYYLFRSVQQLDLKLKLALERKDFLNYFKDARTKNKLLERLTTYYFKEEDGINLLNSYRDFIHLFTENENQDSLVFYLKKQIDVYEKVYLATENIEIKKEMPQNASDLAWNMLASGHYDSAESCAWMGIRNAPDEYSIYTNLAPILLVQGKVKQAIRYYAGFADKPYVIPTYTGICQEIFLNDIDTLIKGGFELPEVERIRKIISNPGANLPKELKKGLALLDRAKKASAAGEEASALSSYEELLNITSFDDYFAADFVTIWEEIMYLCNRLNRQPIPLPNTIGIKTIQSAARSINGRSHRAHRYSKFIDYESIVAQMETAVQLLESAAKRSTGEQLAQINRDKYVYSTNLAFYQLFINNTAPALEYLHAAHEREPNNSLITAKYILALLLKGSYDQVESVVASSTLSNHRRYDDLPSFGYRLEYDLHFLRRRGVSLDQIEEIEGWIKKKAAARKN